MADLLRGKEIGAGHAFEGVAVHAVGVDGGQFAGQRLLVGDLLVAGALVPDHEREQDAHTPAVEVGDHLTDPGYATGKVAEEIVLVAIIDTEVGIGVPDKNAVDAAIALLDVVEVAIDRVFATC